MAGGTGPFLASLIYRLLPTPRGWNLHHAVSHTSQEAVPSRRGLAKPPALFLSGESLKVTHELLKYGLIRSGDYITDLAYSEKPVKLVEGVWFNQWDGSYTLRTKEADAQGNTYWNEYPFKLPEPQTGSTPYATPYVPKIDFQVAPESIDMVRLRILDLLETKGKAVQEFLELLRTMVKA